MPQEDAATGQFEKAQEILGVVLVASNQATKVVKPSEQAFGFPSSPIPSQRASVLGGVFAVAPMGSDQFDTLLLQLLIQRIGVVRPIPDQALRLFREEVLRERFFDELRFLRRSTGNANGDRKTMAVGHGHDFGPLATPSGTDSGAPFFALLKLASMKASETSRPPRARRSSANTSRMRVRIPWCTQR